MAYAKITSVSEIGKNEMNEIDFYVGDETLCNEVIKDVLLAHDYSVDANTWFHLEQMDESTLVDLYNFMFCDLGIVPYVPESD